MNPKKQNKAVEDLLELIGLPKEEFKDAYSVEAAKKAYQAKSYDSSLGRINQAGPAATFTNKFSSFPSLKASLPVAVSDGRVDFLKDENRHLVYTKDSRHIATIGIEHGSEVVYTNLSKSELLDALKG